MPVLQRGCVKSVQRGNKTISDMTGNTSTSINISPIDPNKSLLLCHTNCYEVNNPVELLQSSIVIPDIPFGQCDLYIAYQVVEFY